MLNQESRKAGKQESRKAGKFKSPYLRDPRNPRSNHFAFLLHGNRFAHRHLPCDYADNFDGYPAKAAAGKDMLLYVIQNGQPLAAAPG